MYLVVFSCPFCDVAFHLSSFPSILACLNFVSKTSYYQYLNNTVIFNLFFQNMIVSLSIHVLCESIALICSMNSTAMHRSKAFSLKTSWGMQLDCHLIMSARKYSTLIFSEGASIQFTSMVPTTLLLSKVSMCYFQNKVWYKS